MLIQDRKESSFYKCVNCLEFKHQFMAQNTTKCKYVDAFCLIWLLPGRWMEISDNLFCILSLGMFPRHYEKSLKQANAY